MAIIRPCADLRNNYNEISKICHETKQPVYITKNGYNDLVILSDEAYEKYKEEMWEKKLEEEFEKKYKDFESFKEDVYRKIEESLEDIKKGNYIPLEECFKDIKRGVAND